MSNEETAPSAINLPSRVRDEIRPDRSVFERIARWAALSPEPLPTTADVLLQLDERISQSKLTVEEFGIPEYTEYFIRVWAATRSVNSAVCLIDIFAELGGKARPIPPSKVSRDWHEQILKSADSMTMSEYLSCLLVALRNQAFQAGELDYLIVRMRRQLIIELLRVRSRFERCICEILSHSTSDSHLYELSQAETEKCDYARARWVECLASGRAITTCLTDVLSKLQNEISARIKELRSPSQYGDPSLVGDKVRGGLRRGHATMTIDAELAKRVAIEELHRIHAERPKLSKTKILKIMAKEETGGELRWGCYRTLITYCRGIELPPASSAN